MPSSGLDLSKLTPSNGALTDLKQLVFLAVSDPETLGQLFNFLPDQENGRKAGFVGEFGLIGQKAQGCSPTYGNDVINTGEQTWDIQEWEVAEQICYKDLISTLAKTALQTKTKVDDLTSTEYMDVIQPRLELAIKKMLLRFVLFGKKNADTFVSSSNEDAYLKEGVDKKYFDVIDGFWEKIHTAVTASKIKRVVIEANAKTTTAEQKSTFKAAGVAMKTMDEIIETASSKLRQLEGVIYITQKFADALSMDIRNNNKGSELQWESIFMGITRTSYSGVTVYAIPFMDEIIETCLNNEAGNAGALADPYRAIYTVKDNLLVGTESESEIAELDIFFDKTTRLNHILAKDTVGTMIAQDDLIVVAY